MLDTSAFIYGAMPEGDLETVPTVYAEVRDEQSRLKLELLEGLKVIEPGMSNVSRVAAVARETGDDKRLSRADGDLVALALEEKDAGKDVVILSDDYAVQNVARRLGVQVQALRQKKSRFGIVWEKRCTGCNRRYANGEVCEVCGSPLRLSKRSITRGK